jgi:hypothetical protein
MTKLNANKSWSTTIQPDIICGSDLGSRSPDPVPTHARWIAHQAYEICRLVYRLAQNSNVVPQGPDESSPAPKAFGAGLAFLKSIRPGLSAILSDVASTFDETLRTNRRSRKSGRRRRDGTIDECWRSLGRGRTKKRNVLIVPPGRAPLKK